MRKTRETVAIETRVGVVRGELVERHGDDTVSIRFAGAIPMRGREVTIAEMIASAAREAGLKGR